MGHCQIIVIGLSDLEIQSCQTALKGFEIVSLQDGTEALQHLKTHGSNCELIMMSQNLPKKSGIEYLPSIHKLSRNQIPVILIVESENERKDFADKNPGIVECLTRQEMIPAILVIAIHRSLERKKWEKLYRSFPEQNPRTFLKDPVTGLYNRCYFETRLNEELIRSQRYHFPVTVLCFTIDQYSHILTNYGEKGNQALLKDLGQILAQNIRSSDLAARLQDDNFALLLPHTTKEQAQTVCKRLSESLTHHPFPIGSENIYVTLQTLLIPLGKDSHDTAPVIETIERFMGDEAFSEE